MQCNYWSNLSDIICQVMRRLSYGTMGYCNDTHRVMRSKHHQKCFVLAATMIPGGHNKSINYQNINTVHCDLQVGTMHVYIDSHIQANTMPPTPARFFCHSSSNIENLLFYIITYHINRKITLIALDCGLLLYVHVYLCYYSATTLL